MRQPLVVGNWKMHGLQGQAEALVLDILPAVSGLENIEIAFCPPFVYLPLVGEIIQKSPEKYRHISLGAQNAYCKEEGAFTGEISPNMLTDMNVRFVILGHSERRQWFQETDDLVARKVRAAYDTGLIPIVCVGETASERAQGKTFEVLKRQLLAVFEPAGDKIDNMVLAYEPVWAIGTGNSASPEQAEEVHDFLRDILAEQHAELAAKIRILYGGSVTAENAKSLFAEPNIDGGLIGGASLKAQAFVEICKAAEFSAVNVSE